MALITFYLVVRASSVSMDSSNELWFVEGDRSLALIEKFRENFGNDDFVYVIYETDGFFVPEHIETFAALAEELKSALPYASDVTWVGNAEYMEGRDDSILIEDLLDPMPTDATTLAAIRKKALAEPTFVNALISPDATIAALLVEFAPYPALDERPELSDDTDPRKTIAPVLREILAKPQYRDLPLYEVGVPILDYDMDEISIREFRYTAVLALLIHALILSRVARGFRGIVTPLAVVICGVLWTIGAADIYGFKLNIFIILLPPLLMCVGIGDSMHIIAEFHDLVAAGRPRKDAIREAMANVGWPCLLTSLTTATGFLSFLAADVQPFRELGIYAATGVVLTLVLSFLIVPIAYAGERDKKSRGAAPTGGSDIFDRVLSGMHTCVVRHPRKIVAVFSVLTLVGLYGATKLEAETSNIKNFSTRLRLRQVYDYVDEKMGGSMSIEIMANADKQSSVTDPEFLAKLAKLEAFLDQQPEVTQTISILDVLRSMRRAFHENRPEAYTLPASEEEARQYLLLYEMSGGTNKEELVSFNYDIARLTARTRTVDTNGARRILTRTDAFAAEQLGWDAETLEYTGTVEWVRALTDLTANGQRRSFAVACVAIALIMMLVLRSIPLGLISMVPNVFPVVITLGFMGLAGVYMDFSMMTFSAIIIGVAVDDTIHFFVRFRRAFERTPDYALALEQTIRGVGRPILFTTMTLTLGFLSVLISNVKGIFAFGLLAGFAFTWALLADLLFAPALVMLLKPLGADPRSLPTKVRAT